MQRTLLDLIFLVDFLSQHLIFEQQQGLENVFAPGTRRFPMVDGGVPSQSAAVAANGPPP